MYVAARSYSKRPLCIHTVKSRSSHATLCGQDLTGWSREYMADPIEVLFCKRCKMFESLIENGLATVTSIMKKKAQ